MATLRPLGSTGLQIAPLVLGGNVFGWTIDRPASFAVLEHFVAQGGTMIDTADAYSQWVPGNVGGESETIIGEWLAARRRRDDVQIATKVGAPTKRGGGLGAAWIMRSVEGSLRRLQTDYIDLYYAHRDDTDVRQDETLKAFDRLVRAGKVRAIGASNHQAGRLASALDISEAQGLVRYGALQNRLNLLEQEKFGPELQTLCHERNVGGLAYYSLAMGFLTGAYRQPNPKGLRPRLNEYFTPRGRKVLDVLDRMGAELGATPAQIALAWIAAQPGLAAPIASATSVAQLDEIMPAMSLTLPPARLAELDAATAVRG